MATIKLVKQSDLSIDDVGTYRFSAIVTYRKKDYVVAFDCLPDYEKDYMKLFPNQLRFLQSGIKPTQTCISEIKRALRLYKLYCR